MQPLSYLTGETRKFKFSDAESSQEYHLQVQFTGGPIAVIEFFEDSTFSTPIPIPPAFTMHNGLTRKAIHPFEDLFLINEFENFVICHNGTPVWEVRNPRQQNIHVHNSNNNCDLISLNWTQ